MRVLSQLMRERDDLAGVYEPADFAAEVDSGASDGAEPPFALRLIATSVRIGPMGTPSRGARPTDESAATPRRAAVGRVLGLIGLVEIALTALALVSGTLSTDFIGFAACLGPGTALPG